MIEDRLNKTDKAFAQILESVTYDVDTDELWNAIEERVPTNNHNKAVIWKWSLGLFLIVGLIGFASYYFSNIDLEKTNLVSTISTNTITDVTDKNDHQTENNQKTENSQKDGNSLQNVEEQSNQIVNPISKPNSNLKPVTKQITVDKVFHNFKNEKRNTNNNILSNIMAVNHSTDIHDRDKIQKAIVNDGVDSQSSNSSQKLHKLTGLSRTEVSYVLLPTLNIDGIDHPSLVFSMGENRANMDFFHPVELNVVSSQWRSFYAVLLGANYNSSKYLFPNDSKSASQIDSEKGEVGYESSLRYGATNKNGWQWYTGLSYKNIVSSTVKSATIIKESTVSGTTQSTIDSDGTVRSTQGDLKQTIVNQYDYKYYRQHQFIDLKLGGGKRLVQIGRFNLGVDLGLGYTIYSDHKGYYFEEDKIVATRFTNNNNNIYRKSGNINVSSGLSLAYEMDRTSIMLRAHYLQDLNNAMHASQYYLIKNSQYGLQFGIVYRPY